MQTEAPVSTISGVASDTAVLKEKQIAGRVRINDGRLRDLVIRSFDDEAVLNLVALHRIVPTMAGLNDARN